MNLNSKDQYWTKRSEQRLINAEKSTNEMLKRLKKVYKSSIQEIEKEINAFYGKYATETGLDITEVKKRLDKSELKSFKEQLSEYYSEVKRLGGYSPKTKEYLRELSAKAYISRLESLQAQIRWQVEQLYREQHEAIENNLKDGYKETYMRANFDNQQGVGFAYGFNALDDRKVRIAINQNWQGGNFSDRIWNDKAKLVETLNQVIPQGVALGKNPRVVARNIVKAMDTRFSNAERLARTEMNHIANEASLEAYKETPEVLQQYKIVATLDNRTSEICQEQDGKVYKMSEWEEGITAPPFHPNCRTTTIPYFEDMPISEYGRIATNYETGRAYYVPSNMTYSEWRASLTENQNKYFIADKKAREQYKQDVQQAKEYRKLVTKANKAGYSDLFEGYKFDTKSLQELKYLNPDEYETVKANMRIIRGL